MMSSTQNLVLERWLPVLAPEAQRTPTGRVARIMTFYLTSSRGRENAKHWMEYVAEVEPESLDRIRIGLALAPSGHEDDFSARELGLLRRRVRTSIATARKRWGLPIREVEEDVFYVDLPPEPAHEGGRENGVYVSANNEARRRWGTNAQVLHGTPPPQV
jgi:hypothetical protein